VNRGDRWLLVLPLALTAMGVIMVYSSSAILGITRFQDANYFLSRQLFRAALGIVVLLVTSRFDLRRVEAAAPFVLGVGVLLLALAVAAGHVSPGASPRCCSSRGGSSAARPQSSGSGAASRRRSRSSARSPA